MKVFNKPLMMKQNCCETVPALLHAFGVDVAFVQTDAALK